MAGILPHHYRGQFQVVERQVDLEDEGVDQQQREAHEGRGEHQVGHGVAALNDITESGEHYRLGHYEIYPELEGITAQQAAEDGQRQQRESGEGGGEEPALFIAFEVVIKIALERGDSQGYQEDEPDYFVYRF